VIFARAKNTRRELWERLAGVLASVPKRIMCSQPAATNICPIDISGRRRQIFTFCFIA